MPNLDAALVKAAKQGRRDISEQASIYLEEALKRDGVFQPVEAAR